MYRSPRLTMNTIVADGGTVTFDHFMEWALYSKPAGYYRQVPAAIFGKRADFFTASQLQPVFGSLIASLLADEPVLELGPGAGEMRAAFEPRRYRALGLDDDLPPVWRGTVFANEFFDALPVVAGVNLKGCLHELLVERRDDTFSWKVGAELSPSRRKYVEGYYPALPEGGRFEIAERACEWLRRIADSLIAGSLWIIDYGWAGSEYLRFPAGTLMSYHRHRADARVLAEPGQRDITAHVPFSALIDAAASCGFTVLRFETLSQTLLAALARSPALLNPVTGGQLKTLLFGMGETFRTLVLEKSSAK